MNSFFSWLDYSEQDRQKMLDAIELFGERTTRDELGIGVVRDTFAEVLFPGISTIQTAAKYFLLVPWTFQLLEQKKVPAAKASQWTRNVEVKTSEALVEQGDTKRVIGRRAKENLRRLPSSVYWQGLGTWGIRRFEGFPKAYYRSLDRSLFAATKNARRDFDGESPNESFRYWDPALPPVPAEFPTGARLALDRVEAEYLREKVLTKCSESLLACLLRGGKLLDEVGYFWEQEVELPSYLVEWTHHGRLFSETLHGAQLLYNLILAELSRNEELIDGYRRGLSEWQGRMNARFEQISDWKLSEFWSLLETQNNQVSIRAKLFVDAWVKVVKSTATDASVISDEGARQLVMDRERQLKGSLARVNGGQPLTMWRGDAGSAQLDLRWRAGRRIAQDILIGLEAVSHA